MNTQKNDRIIQFMNNLNITVVDSGYAQVGRDWKSRQVCSPYSRLYYIHTGEGVVTHKERRVMLRQNHIYMIPSGTVFNYDCDDAMEQLYFHVNAFTADGYDLLTRLHGCHELPSTSREIETILGYYRSQRLGDALALGQAIRGDIVRFVIGSDIGGGIIQNHSVFLRRLYPLVQRSLSSKTSQKILAEKMSMSESALAKRFKTETGTTLGQYMDSLLFHRAQHLLLSSEDSIGQIADRLGFCDQFYFSRYFKQRQDETPSQYRKRLRFHI